MQKKTYLKSVLLLVLAGVSLPALAENRELTNKIRRTVATSIPKKVAAPYEVKIHMDFSKEVKVEDVMLRRARKPADGQQVLYVKEKQAACLGVLTENKDKVLFPAVCLKQGDYQLQKISLSFSNGRSSAGAAAAVKVKGDIAALAVNRAETDGLQGVPVSPVAEGKSLQEVYGEDMTDHLRSFFQAKKVARPHYARYRGAAYNRYELNLRVGEPLIYQGKVVALVQKKVYGYGGAFGKVSEQAFAIIR